MLLLLLLYTLREKISFLKAKQFVFAIYMSTDEGQGASLDILEHHH